MNTFDTQQNHARRLGLVAGLLLGSLLLLALALVPLAAARDLQQVPDELSEPQGPHPEELRVEFIPYEHNPVLPPGTPGTWEAQPWGARVVLTDGVTYLFYCSAINSWYTPFAIGYATSTNGTDFSRYPSNPVLAGDGTGFDSHSTLNGAVLLEGITWTLYYGGNTYSHYHDASIGRATATDPAGPWTRMENPVLSPGIAGEWDDNFVLATSVVTTSEGYVMYYTGGRAAGDWMIGVATSTNGITWTKYNDPATTGPPFADSDPVLMPGPDAWDDVLAFGPEVLPTSNGWEMFYSGQDSSGDRAIGYATSTDGISWTKVFTHPILAPSDDPYASTDVEMPTVLVKEGTYWMYYDYLGNHAIGLATGRVYETIDVNTTDDELNSDGDCSLREAIQAANTDTAVDACLAGSGHDTIILPAGTYTLTLHGAQEDANLTGDLDILDHLTIEGDGSDLTVIDGDKADRVIHNHGVTLVVNDLTIAHGLIPDTASDASGGGLYNDSGSVTLNRCTVTGNVAPFGGGLNSSATFSSRTANLAVNDTLVLSNIATCGGAGLWNGAGGVNSTGILTVTRCTVAGNVADGSYRTINSGVGGGIISGVTDGTAWALLTVRDSTVRGNLATGVGASTIGSGGGIAIAAGEATLINSTISGNQANGTGAGTSGMGGGLWATGYHAPGVVSLINTTVSSNTAVNAAGGLLVDLWDYVGTASFHNSLLGYNQAPSGSNCVNDQSILTSLGYNLEDADTCEFDQPTDLVDTDPLLGPLQDNGGDTWTQALLFGSPAVDAGDPLIYPPTDQRGLPRPFDGDGDNLGVSDIGAYEAQEDLIPPAVLATSPVSEAVDIALSAPVMITFSEPISAGSLAYAIHPDPYEWGETWNGAGSSVTLTHAAFDLDTTYTFSVTAAADLSGNPLADAPVVWSFSTGQHQLYLPLILRQ